MSLSQETLLQLMALADDEVEGEDRARVEDLVASDPRARQVLEAMRSPALGAWLSDAMSARSAAADGIADAVMARLAAEPEAAAWVGARGASPGVGGVVRARPEHGARGRRVQILGGALAGTLALAAGVAIYFTSVSSGTDEARLPVARVGSPSVDVQPSPSWAAAALPSQGVEVDEVDSPSRGFSVYEIPVGGGGVGAARAGGPSSVVIMIDDEPVAP